MKIEQEASADCADRLSPTVAAVCDRRASPLCENLRNLRTISHMNTKLNQIPNWPELAREAKWSASALAKQCGVSVRTLHRHWVKQMGKNTKTWLAEQRQQHANELLCNGFSIKETAFYLGYKQQSNFTRKYKSHWGICPSLQTTMVTPPRPQISANDCVYNRGNATTAPLAINPQWTLK
jgi:AraC-like DNA-binding protein